MYTSGRGIYGAPEIVIEVLSKTNHKADLVKKKAVYEEFKVKEYFIVNPNDNDVITFYLEGKKYREQPRLKAVLVSKVLQAEIYF